LKKKTVPKKTAQKKGTIKTKTVPEKKPKKSFLNIKKNKFLIIGIIVLIILIIGIVIATKMMDKKQTVPEIKEDANVTITPPIEETLTEEQLQKKAQDLQLRITKDIIQTQKTIFEGWYPELGLNKEQMDQCYEENDFTNEEINIENAKHLSKLVEDYQLAQAFGLTGTPGIFVNSYKIGGYTSYENITKLIDISMNEEEISFDLNSGNYVADTVGTPKLIIIYNNSNELTNTIVDEYIKGLKEGPYADFFNGLFSEVEIQKIDYREEKAKEILETTKTLILPLFFFEGDINSTEFSKNELFTQAFQPIAGGYILPLPEQQNLNYKYLEQPNDYVIGQSNAPITLYLFTDYDCPYCKQFDNEVIDNLKTNYIDLGLVKLVVKDFVTHQNTALVPAIFSRCAQDQGKYLEAHRKLFENNDLYGSNALESLYAKYDSEIKELEEEYKKLNPETQ